MCLCKNYPFFSRMFFLVFTSSVYDRKTIVRTVRRFIGAFSTARFPIIQPCPAKFRHFIFIFFSTNTRGEGGGWCCRSETVHAHVQKLEAVDTQNGIDRPRCQTADVIPYKVSRPRTISWFNYSRCFSNSFVLACL